MAYLAKADLLKGVGGRVTPWGFEEITRTAVIKDIHLDDYGSAVPNSSRIMTALKQPTIRAAGIEIGAPHPYDPDMFCMEIRPRALTPTDMEVELTYRYMPVARPEWMVLSEDVRVNTDRDGALLTVSHTVGTATYTNCETLYLPAPRVEFTLVHYHHELDMVGIVGQYLGRVNSSHWERMAGGDNTRMWKIVGIEPRLLGVQTPMSGSRALPGTTDQPGITEYRWRFMHNATTWQEMI